MVSTEVAVAPEDGKLFVPLGERQALATSLKMPYTLTTGRPAGTFLAALGNRRILGSKNEVTGEVLVPPLDGPDTIEFVEVAQTGTITALTVMFDEAGAKHRVIALVRLDGTDGDLLHRIVGGDGEAAVGARVRAVWTEQPSGTSILDLEGFAVEGGAPEGPAPQSRDLAALGIDPLDQLPYSMELHYRHAYGPYYDQLFDQLGSNRRIVGSQCPHCNHVLVPPRARCEICYSKTNRWVDVADTGRLQAYSIIELEFVGQTRKPPYVYAEIVLDGSATRLIHTLGGVDPEDAQHRLRIGARVQAVWRDETECVGTLNDIAHFELVDPLGASDAN